MTLTIKQRLCPSKLYYCKCPYAMSPQYITIHNTANDASASNEVNYMLSNTKTVSYHYAVDDVDAIQALPLNRNGFHAGDGGGNGNRKSIGIEICYSKSGGSRFDAAEKNAAYLTALLLKKYGWGISRVKRHRDWAKKYCPHRTMDRGWQRFLNMVSAELTALGGKPGTIVISSSSTSTSTGSAAGFGVGRTYTITASSGLKVRTGAGTGYSQKLTTQLTASGRQNAKSGKYAVLKCGTRITVQAVKTLSNGQVWVKTPSGWICAKQGSKVYLGGASAAASTSTSSKSTVSASSGKSSSYSVGKNYTLQANLKVRKGAGTNYGQKLRKNLTAGGQKAAVSGTYAVLRKGTKVTCQAVKVLANGEVWMQIPSGWICAKQAGKAYVA